MAKDPSKTEKPTPRRLEDARKKGEVLQSEEIDSVVAIGGAALLLIPTCSLVHQGFSQLWRACLGIDCNGDWSLAQIAGATRMGVGAMGTMLLPMLAGVTVLAIIANRAQVGSFLEMAALRPKPESLNPISGVKQILPNFKNLTKLLLILAKLCVIALIIYWSINRNLDMIIHLPLLPIAFSMGWLGRQTIILVSSILAIFIVTSVADYLFRRKEFMDKLMMSKQEVKDEQRNMDGDPKMKGRVRQRMRDLSLSRLISEVPRADVIITNPIHVAVALRYRSSEGAPRVVAKGLRKRAALIRQLARQAGVPLIEAPPLARQLYRTTPTGRLIPPHLYGAVAALLARIYQHQRHAAFLR